MAQLVKESTCQTQEMQETLVGSLGREAPLEKGMAAHSSVLAWTAEPGGYSPWGHRVRHDLATKSPPVLTFKMSEEECKSYW